MLKLSESLSYHRASFSPLSFIKRGSDVQSIVAVHGLDGTAIKTWSTDRTCWLNDPNLLPKYVPNARILTWGYNANLFDVKKRSTSSDKILQHAQTLIAQLAADREVSYVSIASTTRN